MTCFSNLSDKNIVAYTESLQTDAQQ